jgi:uncharacterized membrane protein
VSEANYQPGVCNIGGAEVARRKQLSLIGGILYLVSAVALISLELSQTMRALVFIPALIFAIGYIQSRKKFCLAFGLMGTFNFGALGDMSKVASPEALAIDRKVAISILGQSLVLALAMTALILAI